MEKDEYRKHFALEQDFWWFAGRRRIILKTLQTFGLLDNPLEHLDVGCGTGYDLKIFSSHHNSIGFDLFEDAVRFCQKRDLKKIVQADACRLPFKNSRFDLVTLLDVLYHKNIHNDVRVLEDVYRVLKPGGHLLLTDSAFNFLLSKHDLAFHTRERYSRKGLKSRLNAAGFEVEKMTYFNFFLFFGIALVRILEKSSAEAGGPSESNLKPINPTLNSLLYQVMNIEASLIRRLNFPIGSSILCLAKKGDER